MVHIQTSKTNARKFSTLYQLLFWHLLGYWFILIISLQTFLRWPFMKPFLELLERAPLRLFLKKLYQMTAHVFFMFFFSVRLLSVLRGHSFFHPCHNGQWPPIFYPRFYPLHLFSYLNSWERASISFFNVQC